LPPRARCRTDEDGGGTAGKEEALSGRVLFYVQHLLGVGHLKRAALLARAMAEAGLEVWVVLGGAEVPGVTFDGCARILLPPIRAADPTFRQMVGADGLPVDDALRDARTSRLLTEFEACRPDIVLIEQFPFGRRQFRFELVPLLAAARTAPHRPRIVSSVRDVLVRRPKPERHREMVALAKAWFDCVLVHGDPRLIRLEDSLPEAAEIASLLRYTGYVVEPAEAARSDDRRAGRGEVIVSVGGGAVGEPLLRAALAARPLSVLADHPWRLICGPNLPNEVFAALAWNPPRGVVVERWRNDMAVLLRNCVLSISQGGYNTVMAVLQAQARAIVVPFAEGGQTEQEYRTRVLAKRGVLGMVDPGGLSPAVLADAVGVALGTKPTAFVVDTSGTETATRIILSLCLNGSP
jgi:predicted glycosyltransferase